MSLPDDSNSKTGLVVGTDRSTETETATVQFDFWTDGPAALIEEYGVDAVVFAPAVEYGGEADTGDPDAASFDRFASLVGFEPSSVTLSLRDEADDS